MNTLVPNLLIKSKETIRETPDFPKIHEVAFVVTEMYSVYFDEVAYSLTSLEYGQNLVFRSDTCNTVLAAGKPIPQYTFSMRQSVLMMNFSSYHFCRTSCLKRMSMNKQMIESQQT